MAGKPFTDADEILLTVETDVGARGERGAGGEGALLLWLEEEFQAASARD